MDQYENLMILDYPKPDPKLIEAFREVSVASAHECMDRTNYLSPAIHQYYPGMKLCGPALTVRCQPLDNLTIHAAMHIANFYKDIGLLFISLTN